MFAAVKTTSIKLTIPLHVRGLNNLHTFSKSVLPGLLRLSIFPNTHAYPVLSLDASYKLEHAGS